jgi:hypothetical protein
MKHVPTDAVSRLRAGLLAFVLSAGAAQAACYADYKAKIDAPLRLHYGVIELSDAACGDPRRARDEAQAKLSAAGWTLLNIVSTFGTEGLEGRRADAGQFYLRF